MEKLPFINRIALRNYKSIAACDVPISSKTYLVGPNGAGKSNFVDALRFVSEAIRFSLDHALRDRGGIKEVRRRSRGHPNHFGVRLEFSLDEMFGHYAFEVSARPQGSYSLKQEECHLTHPEWGRQFFRVEEGKVLHSSLSSPPAAAKDRLFLVNVSGFPSFRPIYEALSQMGFYNLNPEVIRDLQTPDPGELLNRDGSNLASVYARLSDAHPPVKKRIEEYLSIVVPGITSVDHKSLGPKETLEFRHTIRGDQNPWRFLASSMSDGTLRAFGVLVALFQQGADQDIRVRLVGIEEPELALHPAAAGVLMDSIEDAGTSVQVIVTSHSPDLLDNPNLSDRDILAVVAEEGETKVGRLDASGREALQQHLYTAGELLRMDQLQPDMDAIASGAEQLNLFGERSQG